jgi:hypothetical protein
MTIFAPGILLLLFLAFMVLAYKEDNDNYIQSGTGVLLYIACAIISFMGFVVTLPN